jgi:hypothetical protein
VELAKSIFQARLGQQYVYGGAWTDTLSDGTDCSGLVGSILEALTKGDGMSWGHPVSTESWNPIAGPGTVGPYGTVNVAGPQDVPSDAVAIVSIHHGGGGPYSHTNIEVDGVLMEDNGDCGVCTRGSGAVEPTNSYWNQWWYLPGPIGSDVRGIDYAGGRINGADIINAGYKFVCRYLSDGGASLPGKLLLPDEAAQLNAAGVAIVSNWETTADRMLGGFVAGVEDAKSADAQHRSCNGPADRPIYFSADWDATPEQQAQIDDYLRGVASVLGPDRVGIYGGYWPVSRALSNQTARWAWQTEAWSGSNVDPRINIFQHAGFVTVGGVQCDENDSYTSDYGQWGVGAAPAAALAPVAEEGNQDEMSAEDSRLLAEVHGALFNKISSESPFRHIGESAVLEQHELPIHDDGFAHAQYVEWAASRGDEAAYTLLKEIAAADPKQSPDRAADIKLAQAVLDRVNAVYNTKPVTLAAVSASAVPGGVAVQPVSGTRLRSPLHMRPVEYAKSIVALCGGLATFLATSQSMLGGHLPAGWDNAIGAVIAFLTGAAVFVTKNEPIIATVEDTLNGNS